ncbi:hypothetical protein [Caballeronia glebae]|uniref:Uncharacterized protein n=1 Tax=Caballeronia glebae TaxID=1777143 RepID=A0A158AF61_9BURK|nr:hypothetical protein [Caballeronia glebae]SAK56360.1 hypothetical protein AWB82_02234 [Caballeronia glebae]
MNASRDAAAQLSERVCKEHDAGAALALLDRSIALKHRRIALIRYLHAQYLDAPLEARHHEYVRAIAARLSAEAVVGVVKAARGRFEG